MTNENRDETYAGAFDLATGAIDDLSEGREVAPLRAVLIVKHSADVMAGTAIGIALLDPEAREDLQTQMGTSFTKANAILNGIATAEVPENVISAARASVRELDQAQIKVAHLPGAPTGGPNS